MNIDLRPKLRCPSCGEYVSKVTNSRVIGPADAPAIRRRRECVCGARYSTVERVIHGSATTSSRHSEL